MTLPKMEIPHVTGSSRRVMLLVYHFILLFSHASQSRCRWSDPYYGHTAKLCSRFVSHLFTCPEVPPPPAPPSTTQTPRLQHFIAYALHRTPLHASVTFAALYLLQRLKAHFPATKGPSGH